MVRRTGGDVVKVEADSLLLRYDDVNDGLRGRGGAGDAMRLNGGCPRTSAHFSYGIGYGDVLDIDEDMFGLEVNLASKIGEDLAGPARPCSRRRPRPPSTPRPSAAWSPIRS